MWRPGPVFFGPGAHASRHAGCPIRRPGDQRMCAPPPGLSRLAASFIAVRLLQASAMDLYSPGHIPAPAPARALRPERGRKGTRPLSPLPSLSSSCQRPFLIRHRALQSRRMNYVGRDRVELSTPALSERCSNQLSYHPIKPAQKERHRRAAPRAPHTGAPFSLSLKRR